MLGDAQGEVAAAVVSGALSLEDGARVIALRARADSGDPVGGAMSAMIPARTSIPFRSRLTGEVVPGPELDGDHWFRDLPEPDPMGLDRALERLRGEGFGVFVEVGPASEGGSGGVDQLWRTAATLFERGFPLDWERVLGSRGAGKADVPTYAFQHAALLARRASGRARRGDGWSVCGRLPVVRRDHDSRRMAAVTCSPAGFVARR